MVAAAESVSDVVVVNCGAIRLRFQIAIHVFYTYSAFLGCQVPHLCKSIIVENTACANAGIEDPRNSRFYCVILQYNSKLNAEQLMRFVRNLIPEAERPGRKYFNFQHASGNASEELTGFQHNGVAPFGMKAPIPVRFYFSECCFDGTAVILRPYCVNCV